jgi:uncharacterized protein YhfF
MQRDASAERMWKAYLASVPDAGAVARRWYEVFRIGESPVDANAGAALISSGVKTATSSLLWSYAAAGKALPEAGSLSIVADGEGNAVCVVETVAVEVKAFDQVDAAFALDYGEWDRTLETWTQRAWAINARRCAALGRAPAPGMPLVCERFRVVYP